MDQRLLNFMSYKELNNVFQVKMIFAVPELDSLDTVFSLYIISVYYNMLHHFKKSVNIC